MSQISFGRGVRGQEKLVDCFQSGDLQAFLAVLALPSRPASLDTHPVERLLQGNGWRAWMQALQPPIALFEPASRSYKKQC